MAASRGGDPEIAEQQDAPASGEGAPDEPTRVRALDFSVPAKFSTEVRRRITMALDGFCETVSEALTAQLDVETQLAVDASEQQTWAAANAALAADAIAVELKLRPGERQLLMSLELPMVLAALECLLGGRAAQAPRERALTEVDWVLARQLLDTVTAELSGAFAELTGAELERGEPDVEGDAGVAMGAAEPTLAIAMTVSIEGVDSGLSLLIPWSSLEPLASRLRGSQLALPAGGAEHGVAELRRGVAGADVLLRAEIGSVQMPIERMLELVPGATVELSERAEDGVVLFAEEVSLGRGRPGRSGTRRALKLEATDEPPSRAATYAKLGRAELERARAHAQHVREGGEPAGILASIFVRVWAELGRTHMTLAGALELAPGAVVELDQAADAPVELFANGLCFASGSLVVTPAGTWGVRVDALVS